MVKLAPTQHASQRTKNRLREHGPEFVVLDKTHNHHLRMDEAMRLLSDKDQWIGWLPCDEVITDDQMKLEGVG